MRIGVGFTEQARAELGAAVLDMWTLRTAFAEDTAFALVQTCARRALVPRWIAGVEFS